MLDKICRTIDKISEFVERIDKWLLLVVVLEMVFDVFMRYFFSRPTIWAYDLSYMLGGAFFTLGLCYVHRIDKHVRVDVLYSAFPKRIQSLLDMIMDLIIFFPTFGLLIWKMLPNLQRAFLRHEKAVGSFWGPPLWPLKTVFLLAIFLLFLQGISNFIKHARETFGAKTGEVEK